MKPHKRKDTPPRREQGEVPPESQETSSAEELAAQQYPAEQVQYDPGQALVDPTMGQPDPGQAYVDPNQVQPDPAQQQAYVDPGQAYVDPNQVQHDPAQAYVDPGQAYDPNAGVPLPPPVASGPPVPDPGPAEPATRSPQRRMATGAGGAGGARRRPATGRASTRYRKPKPSYGSGITVMDVFLFLMACGMLAAVVFVVLPKDLSGVKGHPADPLVEKKDVRNLLAEGQKVMVERKEPLEISEADLNEYINFRLNGEQTGVMSSLVKFRGAYFDFSPGIAEIIIERELFGLPLTMTSRIRPEKFQGQVIYRNAGWSIGKIDFQSRNIKPVIDMFIRMRTSCKDEFEVLRQMNDVRFEEDKVILDPVL